MTKLSASLQNMDQTQNFHKPLEQQSTPNQQRNRGLSSESSQSHVVRYIHLSNNLPRFSHINIAITMYM